jgi:hypothetical protein
MDKSIKQTYDEQGYVIVTGLIPQEHWDDLDAACERVIQKTRAGTWSHRRTVGKQFPPFDDDNPDSWGVQHVMHPQLNEPTFGKWYTSEALLVVVKELLGCSDEQLQLGPSTDCPRYQSLTFEEELFNMLINPLSHDFALRWHRDDVNEKASEEEERNALSVWHYGVRLIARRRSLETHDTQP